MPKSVFLAFELPRAQRSRRPRTVYEKSRAIRSTVCCLAVGDYSSGERMPVQSRLAGMNLQILDKCESKSRGAKNARF